MAGNARCQMIMRNTKSGASWGLAMLADEPEALVLANLCWHLEQGAQEIHLYLDAPETRAAHTITAAAGRLPSVNVTRCDTAFWQRLNGCRPLLQTRRQTLVATQAYRHTEVDWLLHLDADEFLWLPPAQPFAQELASASDATAFIGLRNLERAFTTAAPQTLFEGVFRVPIPAKGTLPAHRA